MKTNKTYLAFLLFFLVFSAGVPLLAAEGGGSVGKVGIVRLSKVFDEYEQTKSSESALEDISNAKQSERERMVIEIRNMRDELLLLNQQGRAEKQKEIEEKMKSLALFERQAKEELQKKREESLRLIFEQIEGVVTEYARQNGFQMILSDRAVLYGEDYLDVTEDVIRVLNSRPTATAKR
ncbi:MAG: OmpH family outer membrane protein [Candidatus Omnitrophica bacterium]|nr:OmpH family outer membrane protein [Candidatus Omnitrophota bacterium]